MACGSRTCDTRSVGRCGIEPSCHQPHSLTHSFSSEFNFSALLTIIHISLSVSDSSLIVCRLRLTLDPIPPRSKSRNVFAALRRVCQRPDSHWQPLNAELPRVKSLWVKGKGTTFYAYEEELRNRGFPFLLAKICKKIKGWICYEFTLHPTVAVFPHSSVWLLWIVYLYSLAINFSSFV